MTHHGFSSLSIRRGHGLLPVLAVVMGTVSSAQPPPPSCIWLGPEPCLYRSDINVPAGFMDLFLTDPARNNYPVPIRVRYPLMPGRRPVVFWNRGGDPRPNGRESSEEWGTALAEAGYVVIHPSRMPIANAMPFLPECIQNGFTDLIECERWVEQSRYGPQNTHFLIDMLTKIDAATPARLDKDRVVVAGHSSGTITVLANAGAVQQWVPGGPVYDERDTRPMAFLAASPQGCVYANYVLPGFTVGDNFQGIDRPFAFISGVHDRTGEPTEGRIAGWIRAMPGHKYLSYDNHPEALHTTMNLSECSGPVRSNHCRWIEAFGLAFLDAVVRRRGPAIDWLMDPNAYKTLTGGAIDLHRR